MTTLKLTTDAQRSHTLPAGSWSNRVVAITGASGGLGTALAHHLGQAGATVILMGRHRGRLEALYDELVEAGAPEPAMIEQDFAATSPERLQGIADVLEQNFSRLDALVHTAALLGNLSPLQLVDDKNWTDIFNVNVHAARDLTLACLPLLRKTENASVLFTLDTRISAYWGPYGVSKAALQAFASMLADETDNVLTEANHPAVAVHGVQPRPMRTRLRRRAFSGELENESPVPSTCIGSFLWLLDRKDPAASGLMLSDSDPN